MYLDSRSQKQVRWGEGHRKSCQSRSYSNRNYTDLVRLNGVIIIMITSISNFIRQNKYKILGGISLTAALYFAHLYLGSQGETKLSSFMQAVQQHKIHQVVFEGNTLFFRSDSSDWFKTLLGDIPSSKIYELIKDTNIQFSSRQNLIFPQVYSIATTCLIAGGAFKIITNKLNKPDISSVDLKGSLYSNGTYFSDYYGGEEIKEKFKQTIDLLRNPEKYQKMGARIRRGILFYGPPGTGKTMLARALANQSGCQFIKMVASELQEVFVGVGAKRVRQLFESARRCKSGCIIFVDEIDALGSRDNHLRDSHQTTTTINQFLSQMDGFSPNAKVLVIAATNRLDLVDGAILRSGRFDVKIKIPLPNATERKGIFNTLIRKKVGSLHQIDNTTINFITESAVGWCGADIQTLINQSIYKAIAEDKKVVSNNNILDAYFELHKLR